MTLDADFRSTAVATLEQLMGRIEVCVGKLNDDQIWSRGQETENAVGNLCLHLHGNLRQWILASLGGEPDERQRDAEFAARGGLSGVEVSGRLRQTVDAVAGVIGNLAAEQLARRYTIQKYEVSGLGAVFHVVEHFAQHTAQIILLTKMLTGEDLGFYRYLSNSKGVNSTPHQTGTVSPATP